MFDQIGKFSARFRYPIIIAWVVLTVVVLIFAPSLADVVTSDQASYLPEDEASVVAARIAADLFPDQASPAQAVLVIKSENGSMDDETNWAYLVDLTAWLENDLPSEAVGAVMSPADPNLADRLISDGGQVAMIFVGLHGSIEDPVVLDALEQMQERFDAAPQGLVGSVTGSVAIIDDYMQGVIESADRTTIITIVLVIAILLVIYRSPVAPFVPLLTIGLAFLVSRGVIAWLTQFGWTVSSITEVVLVVLLFGAGTDYCLFLVSRFREYTADDLPGPVGARRTVGRVGETITSSAGTVIVGMVALSFADMKLFASTGPSLALGVAIALVAGLTLTPALLAVMGKWAFWPGGARHAKRGGFWGSLAHWVTTRPWIPLVLGLIVLVPLTIYGQGMQRNFDLLSDLPDDMPSKVGFDLLSEHFGAGEMQPLDVIVTDIPDARSPQGMAHIDSLTRELLDVDGVADVRSLTLPAGQESPELGDVLRVDGQLDLMLETMDELFSQSSDPAALADMDVDEAMDGFKMLRAYLEDLATAFPDTASSASYKATQASLENLERAIEDSPAQLEVSYQLAEAAAGLSGALGELDASAIGVESLDGMGAQFTALRDYLTGMAGAHPALAGLDGYYDALFALVRIESTLAEIEESLLVSRQLDLLATGITAMAATMQDPAALDELAASPEQIDQLAVLAVYLEELVAEHPRLADQPAFQSAIAHLAAVETGVTELKQAQLVSTQLAIIAQQMDDTALELERNPLALLPKPEELGAAEQMAILVEYMEELGQAYPSLVATEDYQTALALLGELGAGLETIDLTRINEMIAQTKGALAALSTAFHGLSTVAAETLPEATFVPEGLPGGMASLAPDLTPLLGKIAAASSDFSTLARAVRQEMPEATLVPQTALPAIGYMPNPVPVLEASLGDLAASLERLADSADAELPGVTYLPPDDLMAGQADAAVAALTVEVGAFQAGLKALAGDFARRDDSFFIPAALGEQAGEDVDLLLDTYSTSSGDAARLQVVLAYDPFSQEALDTAAALRDTVSEASVGHLSGSTATNLDLQEVMDKDFVRVLALVIGGISIVLVLLLRSLIAPIYMMATILLSYGATMGITRLVFEGIFDQNITWFVPFLIFVVLVALGMDYNIFLMGRVKEEVAGRDTRTGIERAVERTGGIITSAGIIMAGTFAAMMSSSLLGLVQLAFAVAVGVLLDTFVVRTTLVPALATLLGKWNWWPSKGPEG